MGEHKVIKIELEILQQGIKLQIWPVMKATAMNSNQSTGLSSKKPECSAVYLPGDVTQVTQRPTRTLICSKYMQVEQSSSRLPDP